MALNILSPNAMQVAMTFGFSGIVFHSSIRNIEIDNRLGTLFVAYLFTWASLVGIYVNLFDISLLHSVATASYAGLCFNLALATSIGVYRLFFHRLRNFPGPWGAKLSRFYAVNLASKGLQYHLQLEKLHKQYGDFIRTGKLWEYRSQFYYYYYYFFFLSQRDNN